jgi:uncharacterized protein YecE (DUF72 family)
VKPLERLGGIGNLQGGVAVARIRIGLSGWSYNEWRGDFYPSDLPRARELAYAATAFDTLEINGSFYSLRRPSDYQAWRAAAPHGFLFAIKGSRFITHNKKLRDIGTPLANFFASGVLELQEMMGPFLWQLPANLAFDEGRVERFLKLLPHDTNSLAALARRHDRRVSGRSRLTPDRNRRVRHVLEPRHESFFTPAAVRLLRRHGTALAFSHARDWPYTEEITAGFVYVRLHGPDEPYASPYEADALDRWANRIRRWQQAEQPDDARRITDRTPPVRKARDVYVYFDNDQHGHAPRNASLLRRRIRDT